MSKLGTLIMWNGQPTNLKAVTEAGFQNFIPSTKAQGYLSRAIDEIIMEDRSEDWKGKREFFRESGYLRYVVVGLFRSSEGKMLTNSLEINLKDGVATCEATEREEKETFERINARYKHLVESERISGAKLSQGIKGYLRNECKGVKFFNAHFVRDGYDTNIDFLKKVAKELKISLSVLNVDQKDGVSVGETIGGALIDEADSLIKDLYEGIEKLQKDSLTDTEIQKRKDSVGKQMRKLEEYKELLGEHFEQTLDKVKKIEEAVQIGADAGGDKRTFLEALSDL
jgi:hypothetical protein